MRWLASAALVLLVLGGVWSEGTHFRAWLVKRSAENAFAADDIDAAIARYERVQQLLPNDPDAHLNLADTISQVLGAVRAREMEPERFEDLALEASRHYLHAIRTGPPNAWAYAGLGSLAGTLRTLRVSREPISLDELSLDPLQNLRPGDRLHEAALVKAVQLEPRNYYYRDFLGYFYLQRGFEERALAHLRVAARLHPVLDRHFYLAHLATVSPAVLSAAEQGIRDAVAAGDTKVSAYDIHRFLADVYRRMGKLDEAQASLEAAAATAPLPQTVDLQIGQILAARGDDAGALEAFLRAVERDPTYHRAWIQIALTHSRLLQHDEAVEAARRARGLRPTDFHASSVLAGVLKRAGRLDEAAEVLENLVRMFPEQQHPLLELLRVYEQQGKLGRAVEVARQLVHRYPDEPVFEEQLRQLEDARAQRP
jgi:tetratricopeptide (TPR) repeat protein